MHFYFIKYYYELHGRFSINKITYYVVLHIKYVKELLQDEGPKSLRFLCNRSWSALAPSTILLPLRFENLELLNSFLFSYLRQWKDSHTSYILQMSCHRTEKLLMVEWHITDNIVT